MLRTRKQIIKRIEELGGHNAKGKKRKEVDRLGKKFNDILVRAKVRKHGIKSLTGGWADRRYLNRLKRKRRKK